MAIFMIIIIGGANELGAKIAATLTQMPNNPIVIVDTIDEDNWLHLKDASLLDLISYNELKDYLETHKKYIKTIINLHSHALSPQMADVKEYLNSNYRLPLDLYHWCCRNRVRLLHVSCELEDAKSAYIWSQNLLKRTLHNISTNQDREYPTPPQFAHIIIGKLLGKELSQSKTMIRGLMDDTHPHHQLTLFDTCYRTLLWLVNTPSVSTTINLSAKTSLKALQDALKGMKDGIHIASQASLIQGLHEHGFNEPLIPIEQGLADLLKN